MNKKNLILGFIIPFLSIIVFCIYIYTNYNERVKKDYAKSPQAEIQRQIERTNKGISERDEQLGKLGNSVNENEIRKSIEAEKEQVKTIRENLLKELEQTPPIKTPLVETREYKTIGIIGLILLSYIIGIGYYLRKNPSEKNT